MFAVFVPFATDEKSLAADVSTENSDIFKVLCT